MTKTADGKQILETLIAKARQGSFVYREIQVGGYECVFQVEEKKSGLLAIIALHDTSLGFALGGTRIQPYASQEKALEDVLRLSRGMTYKSAVAQTGLGGGKSVIILDPRAKNKKEVLLAFGEVVNQLGGLYVCAEDMGCTPEDVETIAEKTPYVTGLIHAKSSGNPAPFTAWGTLRGIQSSLFHLYGSEDLEGKKIAIQGLGSVGKVLCELLFWKGAELVVSDINQEAVASVVKKYGAKAVAPHQIYEVQCDVFAPCAMGGILNDDTIPLLCCKIVAGAANNQLQSTTHAEHLQKRGILYAPDFVINAGGLYNVSAEIEEEGYNPKNARNKVESIYSTLKDIFSVATANRQSTHQVAEDLAEYRIKHGIGKRKTPPYFHHKTC